MFGFSSTIVAATPPVESSFGFISASPNVDSPSQARGDSPGVGPLR
jgi:hypothetical protein